MHHRPPSRIRHRFSWLGSLAIALASASCGGTQGTQTAQNEPPHSTPPPATGEPAPDLSEVPAPEQIVAVVRVPAPLRLTQRVLQLAGYPQYYAQLQTLLTAALGPNGVDLIDQDAPMDIVVFHVDANGEPEAVFSFGAVAMDTVEAAVGQDYRLVPVGNGVRRFSPLHGRGGKPDDEGDIVAQPHGDMVDMSHCVIAPTPREGSTRVVCADSDAARDGALAYLTRTLTRREVPANTITLDLPVEPMRARYFPRALAELDRDQQRSDSELENSTSPGLQNPATRDAVRAITHEMLDAMRAVLNDLDDIDASLTFGDDRATLHTEVDLRAPSSPLLRALTDVARNQPAVPADLLAKLLPGGWMYAAGTVDARPLSGFANEVTSLLNAAAGASQTMTAQDRAALQIALDLLHQLDQTSFAMAVGSDTNGRPWVAGTMHGATVTPAQWITAMRNVMGLVRRPTSATSMHSILSHATSRDVPDLTSVRDLPTRGLPPGSYGFRIPAALLDTPATPAESASPPAHPPAHGHGHGHAAAPAAPTLDVLLVPSGNNLEILVGADAAALHRQYTQNTTAGIDVQYLSAPNTAFVAAFVPAGAPNLMRAQADRRSQAQELQQLVSQLPDGGRTPAMLRFGTSDGANGLTRIALDFDLPIAALRAYGAMIMQGTGGAAPPPPPPAATP